MINLLETDRDGADYLQEWITTSWLGTAAQAYEGYLKSGRGLLLCDLANATSVDTFNLGLRARCEYVPLALLEQNAADVLCSAAELPALLEQVRDYDPQIEVIYCLTRRKGGSVFYTVGTVEMSARQAYEQRGQRLKQIPELRGRVVGQG